MDSKDEIIEELQRDCERKRDYQLLYVLIGAVGMLLMIWLLMFIIEPRAALVSEEALDEVCVHLMGDDYKWHNGEFSTDSKFYCKKVTPEITYDNTTLIQKVR